MIRRVVGLAPLRVPDRALAGAQEATGRHWRRHHREANHGAELRTKLLVLGVLFPFIMVMDVVTKRWAMDALAMGRRELFGGLIPLTLAYNKGAAFGISIGEDSRWFFVPVTLIALALLWVLFKQASERDYLRVISLSLVVCGAVGNLYDRIRWNRGVVDFIGPIDLGFTDFPIFNVADISISLGAVALALSFWQEERRERAAAATPLPAAPPGESPLT
jgi:signal peptidase II